MQSITINITKNFGKSITLELPSGEKHVITHSILPHFYNDLIKMIMNGEKSMVHTELDVEAMLLKSTLILPDDYEKPEYKQTIHFPDFKGFDGFEDDMDIPLENTEI